MHLLTDLHDVPHPLHSDQDYHIQQNNCYVLLLPAGLNTLIAFGDRVGT